MTPTPKKQRKQLTIVEKLQIIEMKEVKGYGFAKIAREKKLHEASKATKKRLKKDSKIDLGLDREDCWTFSVLNKKK